MKKNLFFVFVITWCFSCSKEKMSDRAGERMQDFVIEISQYARGIKPGFVIIPQNGELLAFTGLDSANGLRADYLNAVDAVTVEELFYNSSPQTDQERLAWLRKIKPQKPIFVADYLGDDSYLSNDITLNQNEGFLCFPRLNSNYYYNQIPNFIIHENNNEINSLNDAQNFLYLLNPENFQTREGYIQALDATNYDVLIIDLFYGDTPLTPQELQLLKTKNNGARRLVISYVNVGSAEKYRYYWNKNWVLHVPHWLRKKYAGYDDEYYVKFWVKEWREIIFGNDSSYIKKIIDAGFDGAFLDNVEAYYAIYYND